jgi:hypothetical protein
MSLNWMMPIFLVKQAFQLARMECIDELALQVCRCLKCTKIYMNSLPRKGNV